MIGKRNWEETQERFRAWWEGKPLDRPIIQVTAPQAGAELEDAGWDGWEFVRHMDDPAEVVRRFKRHCSRIYFGGEAFPNCWPNLGPGVMGAYLGARPRYVSTTVWFQTPRAWEEVESLAFEPDGFWWQKTREITATALQLCQGDYFVAITDLGGILDILASLRGTQNLLLDLVERPQEVRRVCWRLLEIWHWCYDELHAMVQRDMGGSSAWMGLWSPGKWYPLQCDFSAMISPKMFAEFVAPDLQEQCRRLDYSIYHWDGPGQIGHLEALLEIPELDGIQWTPGAGNPGPESPCWFGLYRRIQAAGKRLVLLGVPRQGLEGLLRHLSPVGLQVSTSCASPEEADRLLEQAVAWTREASGG